MNKLLVKPAGSALVPDFDALDGGVLRFVGRTHDPSVKPNGAWVPVDTPVEVPARAEYIQELKRGGLLPANAETAKCAGVAYDAPKGVKANG